MEKNVSYGKMLMRVYWNTTRKILMNQILKMLVRVDINESNTKKTEIQHKSKI